MLRDGRSRPDLSMEWRYLVAPMHVGVEAFVAFHHIVHLDFVAAFVGSTWLAAVQGSCHMQYEGQVEGRRQGREASQGHLQAIQDHLLHRLHFRRRRVLVRSGMPGGVSTDSLEDVHNAHT